MRVYVCMCVCECTCVCMRVYDLLCVFLCRSGLCACMLSPCVCVSSGLYPLDYCVPFDLHPLD